MNLCERMKGYEEAFQTTLPWRMPIIMRLDGRSFHNWTRGSEKPFDSIVKQQLEAVAADVCSEVQGTMFAYAQSDEISLLLHNYKTLETCPWFGNRTQKMISVAAATASASLTHHSGRVGVFDCRVFILPEAEVCNYFVWRQRDCIRNSRHSLARSIFSHKECLGRSPKELQQMAMEKGQDWNELSTHLRYGWCVRRQAVVQTARTRPFVARRTRWVTEVETPLFQRHRDYIEQFLAVESE
jgi:tRNA(His) guanylyltransferase